METKNEVESLMTILGGSSHQIEFFSGYKPVAENKDAIIAALKEKVDKIYNESRTKLKVNYETTKARVPALYHKASIDKADKNFKEVVFKNLVSTTESPEEWMKKIDLEKQGVYLYGGVGCGKTHAGFALINFLVDQEFELKQKELQLDIEAQEQMTSVHSELFTSTVRPRYLNIPSLQHGLKRDMDKETSIVGERMDSAKETPGLLILDDLGAGKTSDWSSEILYEIVNHRYIHQLPTIYISNFSLAELAERIDDRIVSRISGMSTVVHLEGKDRRVY